MLRINALLLLVVFLAACQPKTAKEAIAVENVQPNLIFMIGDGMGLAQVTAANYWNPEPTNYTRFKTIGLSETSSTSHKVTDSAAGATAFSTGQKTYKRAIGVASDSSQLPSILEELQAKGYQTGLISLTSITHATPASFYAHVPDRDMQEEIAAQLVTSGVDFFAGGGWQYFAERTDNQNLYQELQQKGYVLDSTGVLPDHVQGGAKYGFLTAKKSMPSKMQGRADFLKEAALLAIEYFEQSDKPYFLMIEGSYIDWGGHAKDPHMMIQESVDFDQTIGKVLDKTKDDAHTLVVVTADHETGGASIGKYYDMDENGKQVERADTLSVNFITDQHTASLVPVFAKGYKEEVFAGMYANNQIYFKFKDVCGL